MKKTFLTRRNALLTSESFSLGGYILAGVVLILGVRLIAPNVVLSIFSPVLRSAAELAQESHVFFSSLKNQRTLLMENTQLRNDMALLTLENQSLRLQKSGVSIAAARDVQNSIQATVLVRPPVSPYDTLLLAKGSRDGISVGMGVVAPVPDQSSGVPVGVVTAVTDDFSRVTLFTSPHVETAASVGHSVLPITLEGAGAGVFMASVSRAAGVVVGDLISVPGGLLAIGRVTQIDSDPSSPAVILRITPSINIFSLSSVSVRESGSAFVQSLRTASSTLP